MSNCSLKLFVPFIHKILLMDQSYLGTTQQPATPVTENERILGILSHILTLVGGFLAPLIIWLVKKDESAYVSEHAKESLNFQLTLMIAYIIGFILIFIIIGIVVLVVLGILQLVLVIVATIKAADGQLYKYPFCIRFIS